MVGALGVDGQIDHNDVGRQSIIIFAQTFMLLHHLLYSFRIVILLVTRLVSSLLQDEAVIIIWQLLGSVLVKSIVGVPISEILRNYGLWS